MTKLHKSTRILRKLESRLSLSEPRSKAYIEALAYRRALYQEHGAANVRAEIERQK